MQSLECASGLRPDTAYLALAAAEAGKFVGATAPNPPVGACLVAADGQVLAVGAHARAGTEHAEVVAIANALQAGHADRLKGATIYVTLEPCNHFGRTGPCTKAILDQGIRRVVYAQGDPNPRVKGNGAAWLASQGVDVVAIEGLPEPLELIRPFAKAVATARPWVVQKLAYRLDEKARPTMIPLPGQKTFTSAASLRTAHEERRKSDAILTSLNTVLADAPRFDVRLVPDHEGKRRWIAVITRSGHARLPEAWLERQRALGFEIVTAESPAQALALLGDLGALRVLAEAGPRLSRAIDEENLWDERLTFVSRPGQDDLVMRELRRNSNWEK